MSERIQIKRVRGWRKPPNAVLLTRPHSKYANPYSEEDYGRDESLRLYRLYLDDHPEIVAQARIELAGKIRACWCRLNQACHADILLEYMLREDL
jgi:Domain of unknown function (DUF4326)